MCSGGLALPGRLLVEHMLNLFVIVKSKNGTSKHYIRGRRAGLRATGKNL